MALVNTVNLDGRNCKQRWQRDPEQAGVYQDQKLRSLLAGFGALGLPSVMSKLDRSKGLSRAAEFGSDIILMFVGVRILHSDPFFLC